MIGKSKNVRPETKQAIFPWVLIIWLILMIGIIMIIECVARQGVPEEELSYLERTSELVFLEENTIIPINAPYYPSVHILGSVVGEGMLRTITSYNPVPEQTDDTPFITASGIDIRETNYQICASNEFPFGTIIRIEGLGACEIQDRTNKRYKYRIDWLTMTEDEAMEIGKKNLEIEIVYLPL